MHSELQRGEFSELPPEGAVRQGSELETSETAPPAEAASSGSRRPGHTAPRPAQPPTAPHEGESPAWGAPSLLTRGTKAPWAEKLGAGRGQSRPYPVGRGARSPSPGPLWGAARTVTGAGGAPGPPPGGPARWRGPTAPASRKPGRARRRLGSRGGGSARARAVTGVPLSLGSISCFPGVGLPLGKEISARAEKLLAGVRPSLTEPDLWVAFPSEIRSGLRLRRTSPNRGFLAVESWFHILPSRLGFAWLLCTSCS